MLVGDFGKATSSIYLFEAALMILPSKRCPQRNQKRRGAVTSRALRTFYCYGLLDAEWIHANDIWEAKKFTLSASFSSHLSQDVDLDQTNTAVGHLALRYDCSRLTSSPPLSLVHAQLPLKRLFPNVCENWCYYVYCRSPRVIGVYAGSHRLCTGKKPNKSWVVTVDRDAKHRPESDCRSTNVAV